MTAVFEAEPEEWSNWAEVFERHGLPGTVQTDQPPTMSAYFPPGLESGYAPLRTELMKRGAKHVLSEEVAEEDWAEAWKQFFKPVRIGRRLVVRPTWEEYSLQPGDVEIVLDPGQAFGTGDHPTTRMCLELIEAYFESVAPPPTPSPCRAQSSRDREGAPEVADIGCGSGILSIAAAKLGAGNVVGVDTDVPSIEATTQNADRNDVRLTAHLGKGFDPLPTGSHYDLVLSNIISAALIGLAPTAATHTKPGGVWIVSGIIEQNWDDVLKAAEKSGFKCEERRQEGEWVAAVFRR